MFAALIVHVLKTSFIIIIPYFPYFRYRPTSLSRNQGELRNHFEFSEVRDKQIVTRHENCHVRSTLLIESTFQQHILEHDCSNAVSIKLVMK